MHTRQTQLTQRPRLTQLTKATTVRTLLTRPESSAEALALRFGPAALLHLPDVMLVNRALLAGGAASTSVVTLHSGRLVERTLIMLRAFADMQVRFMPERDVSIGRALESELHVVDPTVSKHHATLSPTNTGYLLTDHGSMNGTFLNSVRLAGHHALRDGDIIALGELNLLFVSSPMLFLQLESLRRSTSWAA